MKHLNLSHAGARSRLVFTPLLGLTASALLWAAGAASAATYTFEGLSTGNLGGQDNWTTTAGSTFTVVHGTGFDTSLVVQNAGANSANVNTRVNDGNFSFGSFTGLETNAVLEYDVQINFPTADTENMGLYLAGGAASPALGYNNNNSSPIFSLRAANFGSSVNVSIPGSIVSGDWVRLRLTMNFTTNAGNGSGSVDFSDLTQATAFAPVTGLQNIALNMTSANATTWNSINIRSDLVATGLHADNIAVIIPEPGSVALAVLGGLGLFLHRRRNGDPVQPK